MTPLSYGLVAQLALAAVAMAAALLPRERIRSALSGGASAAMGATGVITGVLAMTGGRGRLVVPIALPLDPLTFEPDRLGGLFIVLASGVGVSVALYGIVSVHGASASRTAWSALAVFLMGMQFVPAAADAVSFLLMWEAMALGSTVLLLADHATSSRVSSATLWYAVMSQLSFLFILAGFAVLAAVAGEPLLPNWPECLRHLVPRFLLSCCSSLDLAARRGWCRCMCGFLVLTRKRQVMSRPR